MRLYKLIFRHHKHFSKQITSSYSGQSGEVAQDVLVAQRNEAQDIADNYMKQPEDLGVAFVDRRFLAMVKTLTNKLSEGYDLPTF